LPLFFAVDFEGLLTGGLVGKWKEGLLAMLTKLALIGQIVAVGDKLSEIRDSGEVRQPEIWTRKFLRRTMNMALGAPIAKHGSIAGRCRLGIRQSSLMLSVCIDIDAG